MRRWHQDKAVMHRQRKRLKWMEHYGIVLLSERAKRPLGRFRKKDAFDCGNTGCTTCHHEKVLGIKSHKQATADVAFREQLE